MITNPIAILGGGNAGHCMAADLTLGGYKVNLYEHPKFEASFVTTLRSGVVELVGVGRAKIHRVTTDIADAISDAELIMVVVPATGQELFFNTMLPHLKDGQVVTVLPDNFGSLLLSKLLREKSPSRKITIYGTDTMPYGARVKSPGKVTMIYGYGPNKKPRPGREQISISALPATHTGIALEKLRELFPAFSPVKNILTTSLSNPNPRIHPMGALLNMGRIEYSRGNFYLYKEGITPSVLKVECALSEEMYAVGQAYGVEIIHGTPSISYESYMKPVLGPDGFYAHMLGPKTIRDRFVTEDVPYGIVPMVELGRKAGVNTPLMDAVVSIASAACQEDYYKTGRTLASLGLDKLSVQEIVSMVDG